MKISRSMLLAVSSTFFALGAFASVGSQESPSDPENACSGSDVTCSGTCVGVCNPKDPNDCQMTCNLTKR